MQKYSPLFIIHSFYNSSKLARKISNGYGFCRNIVTYSLLQNYKPHHYTFLTSKKLKKIPATYFYIQMRYYPRHGTIRLPNYQQEKYDSPLDVSNTPDKTESNRHSRNQNKEEKFSVVNESFSSLVKNTTHVETAENPLAVVDPAEVDAVARELKPSFNLAAYVNESETLQRFVQLGVDLSTIEKERNLAEFVLRLNFETDVKPYIQFLVDNKVDPDSLSRIFTKNIKICSQSLDNLQVRINYLESKKFSPDEIAAIITRNPFWLTSPVSSIDDRLGWLQKQFKLTGDDVRQVVNSLPQIVTHRIQTIKLCMFSLEEEMGMTKGQIKRLLLTRPRIFIKSQKVLVKAFDFVHNVMKVPEDLICRQPDVLMERLHRLRERHQFLASLGRAQYNPRMPGYVSLEAFVKSDDAAFCTEIAKSTVESYNLFLKTL